MFSPWWPEPEPVLLANVSTELENLSGPSCLAVKQGNKKQLHSLHSLFLEYKLLQMCMQLTNLQSVQPVLQMVPPTQLSFHLADRGQQCYTFSTIKLALLKTTGKRNGGHTRNLLFSANCLDTVQSNIWSDWYPIRSIRHCIRCRCIETSNYYIYW